MGGTFIDGAGVQRELLDWGELAWVSHPPSTGAEQLVVIESRSSRGSATTSTSTRSRRRSSGCVRDESSNGSSGEQRARARRRRRSSRPIVVHASFNTGAETVRLTVVLGPCVGADGLRAASTSRARSPGRRCGRRCTPPSSPISASPGPRPPGGPGSAARPGRGRRRAPRRGAQPARHARAQGREPAQRFPLPLILGSDGAGVRRDTGEEVVIFPVAALGRP